MADDVYQKYLSPRPGPELRSGPPVEIGDRLGDWLASKTSRAFSDRTLAPFKAVGETLNGFVTKPALEGAYALSHPAGYSTGELAGAALDTSGVVPGGVLAKGAGTLGGALGAFAKSVPTMAIFAGPKFMGRLQDAGRISENSKGSTDALYEAERAWKRDEDPRAIWNATGWAPGNAFGVRRDGGYQSPIAWHAMPGIDVADAQKAAGVHSDRVGDMIQGADDLRIGAPEVMDLMGNFTINPNAPDEALRGAVVTTRVPGVAERYVMDSLRLSARNPDQARALLTHELTHGVHGIDTPSNASNAFDRDALSYALPNLAATQKFNALAEKQSDEGRALYEAAMAAKRAGNQAEYAALDAARKKASAKADDFDLMGGNAPRLGAYLNSSHERRARASMLNYHRGITDSAYPSDIDTFELDALYPVWPQHLLDAGITPRDFEHAPWAPPQWTPPTMSLDDMKAKLKKLKLERAE